MEDFDYLLSENPDSFFMEGKDDTKIEEKREDNVIYLSKYKKPN